MLWRNLLGAVVLLGALAWVGVTTAHAQLTDGCYDARYGGGSCMSDVRSFNFTDPGIASYGWHLLASRDVIVISRPNMSMEMVPATAPPSGSTARTAASDTMSVRGDYPGTTTQQLYCVVYGRGC